MLACSVDISLGNIVILGVLYYGVKKVWAMYKDWKVQDMLEKYNNTTKDKVILHGIPRGKTLPNISPYCLKLETYLRFANIPYEFESADPFGPKGKSPWISLNGTHVADSHLIIQFLNKKFEIDLNNRLTPDQREICRLSRIALENHFMFGIARWRWIENISGIETIVKVPKLMRPMMYLQSWKVKKLLLAQGLGRHSASEMTEMTAADLKSVSVILGGKKFIGGEEPCEEDCGIFGALAQVAWASPGSPYERIVEEELPNLKEYCVRMKERFWQDWDICLDKSTDY